MSDTLYLEVVEKLLGAKALREKLDPARLRRLRELLTQEKMSSAEAIALVLRGTER